MARTKQTAKKSTGGPAPKFDLSSQVPDPSVEAAPPQKKSRTAPKYPKLKTSGESNNWCSGCEDGGRLVPCSLCPRNFCDKCIEFPAELSEDSIFYCAKCWVTNAKGIPMEKAGNGPYQGFWLNGQPLGVVRYLGSQTLRGQWPIIDTARMVVITIRLEGMGLVGDAADVVHRHLVPYYQEDPAQLKLVDLTYNLWDAKKRAHYGKSISRAIADLEELYKPETVVVFITTHSTPDTGDLWIAPGGTAAAAANQVLPLLIPHGLQSLVEKATGSLLTLIACGGVNRGVARDEVSVFVRNAQFQYGIGFAAERFLPASANTFLQDVVHSFFIAQHGKGLPRILASHYELGIHSDVLVYFRNGDVFRYAWHHPARHPYGQAVPHQCPDCFGLQSYKVRAKTYTHTEVTLYCPIQGCQGSKTYSVGQLERVEEGGWSAHDYGVRGIWYGEWVMFKNGRPPQPPFGGKVQEKTTTKVKNAKEKTNGDVKGSFRFYKYLVCLDIQVSHLVPDSLQPCLPHVLALRAGKHGPLVFAGELGAGCGQTMPPPSSSEESVGVTSRGPLCMFPDPKVAVKRYGSSSPAGVSAGLGCHFLFHFASIRPLRLPSPFPPSSTNTTKLIPSAGRCPLDKDISHLTSDSTPPREVRTTPPPSSSEDGAGTTLRGPLACTLSPKPHLSGEGSRCQQASTQEGGCPRTSSHRPSCVKAQTWASAGSRWSRVLLFARILSLVLQFWEKRGVEPQRGERAAAACSRLRRAAAGGAAAGGEASSAWCERAAWPCGGEAELRRATCVRNVRGECRARSKREWGGTAACCGAASSGMGSVELAVRVGRGECSSWTRDESVADVRVKTTLGESRERARRWESRESVQCVERGRRRRERRRQVRGASEEHAWCSGVAASDIAGGRAADGEAGWEENVGVQMPTSSRNLAPLSPLDSVVGSEAIAPGLDEVDLAGARPGAVGGVEGEEPDCGPELGVGVSMAYRR
ncbi:hypothetical protein B0H12DRAFT_1067212 [Mycena haematopus]|nr:hypothetical protein B0H12DRAFT_1067212 [Mycena haematopus]